MTTLATSESQADFELEEEEVEVLLLYFLLRSEIWDSWRKTFDLCSCYCQQFLRTLSDETCSSPVPCDQPYWVPLDHWLTLPVTRSCSDTKASSDAVTSVPTPGSNWRSNCFQCLSWSRQTEYLHNDFCKKQREHYQVN